MDCETAREKINIFDSLSQQEKDKVLAHAQSCPGCRQELIASAKLREELAELDEVEPPAGLAQSAIKKAKKTVRIPPMAYISVAVAAVIAVAFFTASSILGPKTRTTQNALEMDSQEEMFKSVGEDSDMAAGMQAAEMPEDAADEGSYIADSDSTVSDDTAAEDENFAPPSQSYIYVPADKAEFAAAVEKMLEDNGIYTDSYMADENSQVIIFVIGELNIDEFNALLEEYAIEYDTPITAGSIIEMTVEK